MEVSVQSRRNSKGLDTPSTSEAENQVEPIDIGDIFKYYDFEPANIKDKQVAQILRQNKKNMIQRMIDRLNRVLPQISQFLPDFSPLEYYIAFDLGSGDPDNIILQSTDKKFIKQIKSEAHEKILLLNPSIRQKRLKEMEMEREKELNAEEEDEDDCQSETDTDSDDSEDEEEESQKKVMKTRKSNSKGGELHITHRHHRVRDKSKKDDLPLPDGVDPKVWHKWSTIHQASYLAGIQNPNTYFYRNVAPGEKQKNGPWSSEEKRLFLKRLEEVRQEGTTKPQWGIFSQAIPGRVGYQCANFYRKLIKDKEIQDNSYYTDEDGILRHKKIVSDGEKSAGKRSTKDEEPQISLYEKRAQQNPLCHAIDNITKEEIKVPALSPDFFLLDYNTWLNIIKTDAKNPFTMAHINKRQLIILTKENYDEYRDKIKNLQFDD